ncbi:MAG: molecular chaperone DnaJ, partial [Clostridia bacterium]|nr:molecular chaperone DnaJ [Clostridia bacterium]
SGSVFRIKGRGIAVVNTKNRGDYLLTIEVETPKNLNSKQKELLRELENLSQDKNNAHKKSFWDKVKSKIKNDTK